VWLTDGVNCLGQLPERGPGINNAADSYVLVFDDKLLVKGQEFNWSTQAIHIVATARRLLRDTDTT
jgi:hypothetical protein